MEALLAEKSRLVAENDRLLRENTGLQVPRAVGSTRGRGGGSVLLVARGGGWQLAGGGGAPLLAWAPRQLHRLQTIPSPCPPPAPPAPQELLEFSLVHQAQWAADGDLFGEPCDEGEGGMGLGEHAPSDLAAGAEGGGAAAPAVELGST